MHIMLLVLNKILLPQPKKIGCLILNINTKKIVVLYFNYLGFLNFAYINKHQIETAKQTLYRYRESVYFVKRKLALVET